ncbi:uncharacterized protein HMPREF1541_08714 [Cyphellophora europaea CBS 101466]|uniref:RNA polymerase I-specific transcription initiation factor RRN6-like protein n=1 Tax=Cyphellophora europaea (strain CBS 101466) TaxID=1220924 RepID=W2RJ05_CYPE1|nr:uncharacterized protein HMPREF1541_08714 [Cyphellophora europaea CBS 101466]ETN36436.1 hypothetical protein HMPREF1541_08714 [Cyphellophora europaea CBS 101466]
MADITRKVRGDNAHEPDNLAYGHFGRPRYDNDTETWRFLREPRQESDEAEEDDSEENGNGLILVHERATPGTNVLSDQDVRNLPSTIGKAPLWGPFRRRHDLVLAFKSASLADPSIATVSGKYSQQNRPLVAFGCAWSRSETGHHNAPSPIVLWIESADGVLRCSILEAVDHDDVDKLPLLGTAGPVGSALLIEPVLGLCFSADKRYLALRQRSGTTICLLVMNGSGTSNEIGRHQNINLQHIVKLERAATGGHSHADVAFHPCDHNLVGIVDEHGNWSAWQISGRRSATARILYKAVLRASGKLLPSSINAKQFGKQPYFDGWHKICSLEKKVQNYRDKQPKQPDKTKVLLVCSRRVSRAFCFDGSVRGDVDMRLGRASDKNWILDIQASAWRHDVCFVLTTARVMVMRLSDHSNRQDELETICSWIHFRARGDLSLDMTVLDTTHVTGLIISSQHGLNATIYWLHWADTENLSCAMDPQHFTLPRRLLEPGDSGSTHKFEIVCIDNKQGGTIGPYAQGYLKLVALLEEGGFLEATYRVPQLQASCASALDISSGLGLTLGQQSRVKSSRVVENEEELLDFIVPDDSVPTPGLLQPNTRPRPDSSTKKAQRTRDWAEILDSDSTRHRTLSLEDALGQLNSVEHDENSSSSNLQTLAELLSGVHISDVEEASIAIEDWQQAVHADDKTPQAPVYNRMSLPRGTRSFLSTYQKLTRSYLNPMANDLPDRAKVQTERLLRTVAFDQYMSAVVKQPTEADQVPETSLTAREIEMTSSPPGTPPSQPPNEPSEDPLSVLKRYTTITKPPPSTAFTIKTVTSILAHLPTAHPTNPATYSYEQVEARLTQRENQDALASLDERERRRAERAAARQQRKLAQQQKLREAATQQSSLVPGLVVMSSPGAARDRREVQSSQLAPLMGAGASSQPSGVVMTQPERGVHGERRKEKGSGKAAKRGTKRMKGF